MPTAQRATLRTHYRISMITKTFTPSAGVKVFVIMANWPRGRLLGNFQAALSHW
jgi:hypothetical protein